MRKSQVLRKLIFVSIVLCCAFLMPLCAYAVDETPQWVGPDDHEVTLSGITFYCSQDGTASAEVTQEGIVWLRCESAYTAIWIGLDNADGLFEEGSRFYARWVTESDCFEKYGEYHARMDISTRSRIDESNLIFVEVGVESPDGIEYRSLPRTVPIYVQLSGNIDKEDCFLMLVSDGEDERVSACFVTLQSPEGRGEFLKIDVPHLGEPILIGQRASLLASIFSGYHPLILCAGAAVLIVAAVIIVRNRKIRAK